ncbi:MAG: hypothetical protein WA885_06655 [Phormidesmis sp.]
MRSIYSALLLAPFAGLLLATTPAPDSNSPQQATITRLVLRDYQVTISSGENGVARYDVYAQDGQPLETNLVSTSTLASSTAHSIINRRSKSF